MLYKCRLLSQEAYQYLPERMKNISLDGTLTLEAPLAVKVKIPTLIRLIDSSGEFITNIEQTQKLGIDFSTFIVDINSPKEIVKNDVVIIDEYGLFILEEFIPKQ